MKNQEVAYKQFDEEGFREAMLKERKRLEALAAAEKLHNVMDLYYITMGRISGLSLALSHLNEYTVE